MQALLAVLSGLVAIVLVPLALAGGTAWLLLPGHLILAVACSGGAVLAGWRGQPTRARLFGGGYLAATLLVVAALALGSEVRDGSWYWMFPWAVALFWGWIPPVIAGIMTMVADTRRRGLTRRVVRKRRRAKRPAAKSTQRA